MKTRYIFLILSIFLLSGCQILQQNEVINSVSPGKDLSATSTPTSTAELVKPNPETPAPKIEPEKPEVKPIESEIPNFLDYPVAFISQAPYAIWDDLHKEACEEAAMITVAKYFNNEPLTAHTMEQGIINLAEWEEANNYQIDLTAAEAAEILKNYFNLKAELITEVTPDRIKALLLAKKLIIIPAAGRQLDNPYFQTPGPIYHMLVIRGYDDRTGEFITNDVGTKRGEGFRYQYQNLIAAIHDWDPVLAASGMTDEEIEQGRKVMIAVSK